MTMELKQAHIESYLAQLSGEPIEVVGLHQLGGEASGAAALKSFGYVSLQRTGELSGPFAELYTAFWTSYLDRRPDAELLSGIQPWVGLREPGLGQPQGDS